MGSRRPQHEDYTVGWVCALPIELSAAIVLLDERHQDLPYENEPVLYTLGRIHQHNVVIASLPAGYKGTNSAAVAATTMKSKFKSIRFSLMVGVGGGVPSTEPNLRLGDVVISQPTLSYGGVVQYDIGKAEVDGFQRTGALQSPPFILLNAVSRLQSNHYISTSQFSGFLATFSGLQNFSRDRAGPDVLFEAEYQHVSPALCARCDQTQIISRPTRSETDVEIYYGTVASGNQLIKDGRTRDRLSAELGGVLCFEMEAAGLMNTLPCLVIRGICDYADSHKTKAWQPYAVATAASCAKEILGLISAAEVTESAPTVEEEWGAAPLEETGETTAQYDPPETSEVGIVSAGSTWTCVCQRGHDLHDKSYYSEAEQEFREAAGEQERLLGISHQDTLHSVYWVGRSLYEQDKYEAAEEALRKTFDGRARLLGKNHADTLDSAFLLVCSLYEQDKCEAAEEMLRKDVQGKATFLWENRTDTVDSNKLVAQVFVEAEKV